MKMKVNQTVRGAICFEISVDSLPALSEKDSSYLKRAGISPGLIEIVEAASELTPFQFAELRGFIAALKNGK